MGGVSGSGTPCAAMISRIRCLPSGFLAYGLEGEGREALVPANVGSDLDHEGKIGALQDLDRAAHGVRWRLRADLAEQPQRLDPLVQLRAGKRLTDVACAVSLYASSRPGAARGWPRRPSPGRQPA